MLLGPDAVHKGSHTDGCCTGAQVAQQLAAEAAVRSVAAQPARAAGASETLAAALLQVLLAQLQSATELLAQDTADCPTAGQAWQRLAAACTAGLWVSGSIQTGAARALQSLQANLQGADSVCSSAGMLARM